jgi:hypothetical protein
VSASEGQVRWLRIFGVIAVIHSALLVWVSILFLRGFGPSSEWHARIWVASATLWFFWPIILALHPAQSASRTLIPLAICAPLLFGWFRFYSALWGPYVFGLPLGVHVSPFSVGRYAISYAEGCFEAEQALKHNEIVLEGYGFGFFAPMAPKFERGEWQRLGIQKRSREGCNYNERIVGHAAGWNTATMKFICQRFPEIRKRKFATTYPWESPGR